MNGHTVWVATTDIGANRVKGRPHYYSTKREEYAHVKFDLDAGKTLHTLPHHHIP